MAKKKQIKIGWKKNNKFICCGNYLIRKHILMMQDKEEKIGGLVLIVEYKTRGSSDHRMASDKSTVGLYRIRGRCRECAPKVLGAGGSVGVLWIPSLLS